jgi:YggT family protein
MGYIIYFIQILVQLLSILIIVKVILSYFMSPYHPVREFIDRIIEPMLNPIRRILPPTGPLDFSPILLLILIQIAGSVLIGILRSL